MGIDPRAPSPAPAPSTGGGAGGGRRGDDRPTERGWQDRPLLRRRHGGPPVLWGGFVSRAIVGHDVDHIANASSNVV